jgi:hypothetical protein
MAKIKLLMAIIVLVLSLLLNGCAIYKSQNILNTNICIVDNCADVASIVVVSSLVGGVATAGYYGGLVAAGAAFFVIPMIWLTITGL